MANDKNEKPKQVLGSYAASKGASIKEVRKCSSCNGTGEKNGAKCTTCNGDGLVANPNSFGR